MVGWQGSEDLLRGDRYRLKVTIKECKDRNRHQGGGQDNANQSKVIYNKSKQEKY